MIIILCEKYIHFIIIFYIKCIIYNHFWCVRPTKMSCFFFLWYGVYFQNLLLECKRLAQSSPKGVRSSDWTWPVHLVAQPTFNASPDTDLQTLTNMLLPATVLSDYLASSSVDIPLLAKNKFNHLSISDDHYFFKPDRFVIIIQPWS